MKLIEGLTFELPHVDGRITDLKIRAEKLAELSIKELCHYFYNKALRDGFLKKPDLCECCKKKSEEGTSINGHHEDYAFPLKVMWLCRGCHQSLHHKIRNLRKERVRQDYLEFIEKRMATNQEKAELIECLKNAEEK